ncbi:MAG: hypothetical protein ACJ76V_09815 [Thermoleophilaceae bacterium]
MFEAVGLLDEVLTLACDCGYGLELLGPPEPVSSEGRGQRLELLVLAT